jgi:hypothetical protein
MPRSRTLPPLRIASGSPLVSCPLNQRCRWRIAKYERCARLAHAVQRCPEQSHLGIRVAVLVLVARLAHDAAAHARHATTRFISPHTHTHSLSLALWGATTYVGAQSTASCPNLSQYSHCSGQSAEKCKPTCLQLPHVMLNGGGRDMCAFPDSGVKWDSGLGWDDGEADEERWVRRKRFLVSLPSLEGLGVLGALMVAKARVLFLRGSCICDEVLGLGGWGNGAAMLKCVHSGLKRNSCARESKQAGIDQLRRTRLGKWARRSQRVMGVTSLHAPISGTEPYFDGMIHYPQEEYIGY